MLRRLIKKYQYKLTQTDNIKKIFFVHIHFYLSEIKRARHVIELNMSENEIDLLQEIISGPLLIQKKDHGRVHKNIPYILQ